MNVEVFESAAEMGRSAAAEAGQILRDVLGQGRRARIVVATGNSQLSVSEALTGVQGVDWGLVEVFHMDEYVGLSADHPASFRRWIKERIADRLHPGVVYFLEGDAPDLAGEIARYSQQLTVAPIDLAFVGFGENGHIAFNDPPVADFEETAIVKQVRLDEACRRQQVGEGHFPDLQSVPQDALTMTCPALFAAQAWISCVPERRKAQAVKNALEGPIAPSCPASLIRRHARATLYLDRDSAALLR